MSKRWKPGLNEVFWYINSGNKIDYTTNNGFGIDEEKIAAGNCFFTQAEAQAAAEKVKALLLSLRKPVTNCDQLPKLTAEVFDRPDCPEWAKYAAVDSDGDGFFYEEKPRVSEADGEWLVDKCITGLNRIINGDFTPYDWQNSLIERPAKALPDWCKDGEWIYLSNAKYYKIEQIRKDGLELSDGVFLANRDIHAEAVSARIRPYNADEMKALVGKPITMLDGAVCLCTAYSKQNEFVILDSINWDAQELLDSGCTLDGKPCGKLEHLENGKWVK